MPPYFLKEKIWGLPFLFWESSNIESSFLCLKQKQILKKRTETLSRPKQSSEFGAFSFLYFSYSAQ